MPPVDLPAEIIVALPDTTTATAASTATTTTATAADDQVSGTQISTPKTTTATARVTAVATPSIRTTDLSVEQITSAVPGSATAALYNPPSPLDIPILNSEQVSGSTAATANSSCDISSAGVANTTETTISEKSKPKSLTLAGAPAAGTEAPVASTASPQAQSKSATFAAPPAFLRSPKSFKSHRQNALSVESIPRQTMLKALASTKSRGPFSAGLDPGSALSSRMDSLTLNTPGSGMTDGSLKHPLQSPCFFHEKFDDVINIDKVLEEVKADSEYTSHHRLLQTATGVREVARQLGRKPIKMQVKSVMIVTKARDNTLVTLTREVAHWLMKTPRYGSDFGVTVYVDEKLQKSKRFDAEGLINSEPRFAKKLKYWTPDLCWTSPEKFDLVLTLGGDGTVLFTSWLFQRIVPPILSFSLGSLGFMTNFPFDMYKQHLDKVLTEGMRINMRMRFTCTVYRDSKGQMEEAEQFEVLNGNFTPARLLNCS